MTNREAGINVVREMMGDQAAAKLSASADSNTFRVPLIAAYAVDSGSLQISGLVLGLDRRSRSLSSDAPGHDCHASAPCMNLPSTMGEPASITAPH